MKVFLLQYENFIHVKFLSSSQSNNISTGESSIVEVLKQRFPKAKYIEVQDISGNIFQLCRVLDFNIQILCFLNKVDVVQCMKSMWKL